MIKLIGSKARFVAIMLMAWLSAALSPGSLAAEKEPHEGSAKAAKYWSETGWPLLQEFCIDCHNADNSDAELDLSSFATLDGMDGGGNSMQRVLEMVRFGAMPPEDADLPSEEQRKQLVASLDRTMFAVACDLRPRPGKVTARRLNRAEYNHSIRDLFKMDLRPADQFPSDEVGAGFDNNSDVLSLSTMLIEKYLTAAESVAEQVLIDPDKLPRLDDERASDQLLIDGDTATGRFNGRFLRADAFAWADFKVPVQGEYRIRIYGGLSKKSKQPGKVAVYDATGLLRGVGELPYFGGGGSSKNFSFNLKLEPGEHRFYIEPLEKKRDLKVGQSRESKFAKLDADTVAAAVKRQKQQLRPDNKIDDAKFPFMLREIHVRGPSSQPKEAFPPSQHLILRRYAKRKNGKWSEVEQSAKECLRPLLRRAFREPVSDEELMPYVQLVVGATNRGESYYRGLQVAISAALVSPRFLFRTETPPENFKPEEDGSVRLTQHQLATRLSYFLWSSLPDDRLNSDADKGKLDDKRLEQHVRRMLDDKRGDAMASQFAAQWLGLRNLSEHEADAKKFADFTPSLRSAMLRETELLFLHMMRQDQPVAAMLNADFTFVNDELAAHYQIDGVKGAEFQRVSLKDTPRRGLLSHASILTLTSSPVRTSPVKRGKWVLENLMGTPPPDPPPGVPELEETKTADADASLREQLELHRADPSCAACHRVMDQLGFGMEEFDAIGRFRKFDGKLPIDASGELPGGRRFSGVKELSDRLSETEQTAFAKTVVERLLTFALGRGLTPADRCTVDEILEKTAERKYRLRELIMEVVRSRPFQYYDWTSAEAG